jgi:hypothetical protein
MAGAVTKLSLKVQWMPPLPEDFEFVVGPTTYACSQTVASVYCRTVRLLLLSDPTATFITYPDPDPRGHFRLFVQVLNGGCIHVDESNCDFLWRVSNFFQCDDLITSVSQFLRTTLTLDRALAGIRERRLPSRCCAEIAFLARNFAALMKRPEVAELPPLVLDAVVSHRDFARVPPRALLAFLMQVSQTKKDPEYYALFAHVSFEGLDAVDMKQFFQQCPPAEISGALWAAVAARLGQADC